jgi:hypothetical protein
MKMDAYSVAALFVRGDGYYSVRDVVQLWTEDALSSDDKQGDE